MTGLRTRGRGAVMGKHLTIGETAKRLGLEVDTVRKLERAGKLQAARTEGGHRRFTEEEIDRFRRAGRKGRKAKNPRAPRRARAKRRTTSRGLRFQDDPPVGPAFGAADVGLEIDEEDTPIYGLEDPDIETNEPPPPRRSSTLTALTAPPLSLGPTTTAPSKTVPLADAEQASRLRLQTIKVQGRSAIPWDLPGTWRGKVIADLERFVTPMQFPSDLSLSEATNIVRARVAEVLRPYREAEEASRQRLQAKLESDRRWGALIAHGNEYARQETDDWDWSAQSEARAEVEKVLARDVQNNWTELEAEDAVDEILDEWIEEDEEGLEEG